VRTPFVRKSRRSAAVRAAVSRVRYEVLPTPKVVDAVVAADVPRDVRLTVTASPAKGIEATLDCAERLIASGYSVTPHLAARSIRDRAQLVEIVERLATLGVDDVFVPAGDADPPVGEYTGSLELLRDLTDLGRPFRRVGITGYPESHPFVADDVILQSMVDKHDHATYAVSNMCFDAVAIQNWVQRLRATGITLPVLIGLPGPVEPAKLLSIATRIGVGESTRFLTKNVSIFARIALPGAYRPERLLERLTPILDDPAAGIEGLHVFTFNQLAGTERWRRDVLDASTAGTEPPARGRAWPARVARDDGGPLQAGNASRSTKRSLKSGRSDSST
jgi:methylenetetrahydrofolate reductase (NADH)